MEFELAILMLIACFVCMIFGLIIKNIVFGVAGAVLAIFIGISLAGGTGLSVTRVVNDTLTTTSISGVWVGAFGSVLILIGLGIILLISLEMLGGER